MHPGDHLLGRERLDDVVVGADARTRRCGRPRRRGRSGTARGHRSAGGAGGRPRSRRGRAARRRARRAPDRAAGTSSRARAPVSAIERPEPFLAQVHVEEPGDRGVVLDDHHDRLVHGGHRDTAAADGDGRAMGARRDRRRFDAMITADARRRTDHRAAAGPDPQPVRQRRHARTRARRCRNADLLQTYLEGAGLDVAALRQPARAGRRSSPASRAAIPTRADAVPDGPHRRRPGEPRRLVARPVRRRADRRRGVGPRRHRHALHHVVDGRRLPPAGDRGLAAEGHADLLRRRRRGGRRALGRRVHDRQPLGRGRRRLRAHRVGRLVDRSATTAPATSPSTSPRRASPGAACGSTARPATARCRTASDNALDHRGRDRPPARRRSARRRTLDDLWQARLALDRPPRRPARRAVRPGDASRRPRRAAAPTTPASPTPAPTRRSRRT